MTAFTKLFGLDGKGTYTSGLLELFIDQLKDIYWAEQKLVDSLGKLSASATTHQLSSALKTHLLETQKHVNRLEHIFELLDRTPETKKCQAMVGLIIEAEDLIDDTEIDTLVRDVALISISQKIEHYEIATYGTLHALALELGFKDVAVLLAETLEEEKNTDIKLSTIASNGINRDAKSE